MIAAALAAIPEPARSAPPAAGPSDDRSERWQAARNGRLQLPLPGTPDTSRPLTRLEAAGVTLGVPILIRAFKAESELEVWVKKGSAYVPFATYPICYWSGALGPKLREGDRQTPEGFYTITERLLHHGGRWRRSLNIGYPNVFDRAHGRSGSNILVHGGCDSIGCLAMTDPVNNELYDLVSTALRNGTDHVPVHVFPFRMTDANMAAHPAGRWADFWQDLKLGYDSFERTRLPPHVSVCGRRYHVRDTTMFEREPDGILLCPQDYNTVPSPPDEEQAAAPLRQRAEPPPPACSTSRASCRKWVALRERRLTSRAVARQGNAKRSTVR